MENNKKENINNDVSNLEQSTRILMDILIKQSSTTKLTSMLLDTLYINEADFKENADLMILEPSEQRDIVDSIVNLHEKLNLGLQKILTKLAAIKQVKAAENKGANIGQEQEQDNNNNNSNE